MLCAYALFVILIHHVDSRPNGPPSEACSTITPQHGENSPASCGENCAYSLQVMSINGVSITPLTGTIGYVSASDVFGSMHIDTLPYLHIIMTVTYAHLAICKQLASYIWL